MLIGNLPSIDKQTPTNSPVSVPRNGIALTGELGDTAIFKNFKFSIVKNFKIGHPKGTLSGLNKW